MTARLPNPGGDNNTWGDVLNSYPETARNTGGSGLGATGPVGPLTLAANGNLVYIGVN